MRALKMPYDLLKDAAAQYSHQPAIMTGTEVFTYKDLDLQAQSSAEHLAVRGVKRSDKIALLLPNDPAYVILLNAIWRLGAIACPISTFFPKKQVDALLRQIHADWLIAAPELYTPGKESVATFLNPAELVNETHHTGVRTFGTVAEDRAATIILTSGSSGQQKPVLLSYANQCRSAAISIQNMPLEIGDRWLLSLPLYHIGGLSIIFRCLTGGATVVIPEKKENLPDSMRSFKPTHLSLVLTQLHRLVNEYLLSSHNLKAVLVGGSGLPALVVRQAVERGFPLFTTYGLTEMTSQVTTTAPGDNLSRLHTSGRLLPGNELMIDDSGEILVRGETLFMGYVENDTIQRPLDKDGWFHTNDLGHLDADGYLTVQGRRDNMFISGGENIQPEEIERYLNDVAGIHQQLVVPVSNWEYGARPAAFLEVDNVIDPQHIRSALENHIARYKIPERFFLWPSHIQQRGFKPDRRRFKELAENYMRYIPRFNHKCLLCESKNTGFIHYEHERGYWRCFECRLTFLPPQHHPDNLTERIRYEKHRNTFDDPGYSTFLNQIVECLAPRLVSNAHGLDYGSGPQPALARLFEARGLKMQVYDAFFAPDSATLNRTYSFAVSTETAEHFFEPLRDFKHLDSCLEPGAWLAVMTQLVESDAQIPGWWYLGDFTHICFYRRETMAWIARYFSWDIEFPQPNITLFRKRANKSPEVTSIEEVTRQYPEYL